MGTTLTGTTPATTYDSLIKVTDNGPLSGTAKYLSDGLGNDSALALSTTAVGVGNTSPQGELDVKGSTNVAVFLRNASNGDTNTDGLLLGNVGGIPASYQIWNYENGFLRFGTNASERMRIDSAGNVGIGTNSPTTLLDARITGTTSGAVITVGNTGSGGFGGLAVSDGGAYPVQLYGPALAFLTGNSSYASATEKVRITSAGLVGIGTSSPSHALDVNGNIRVQGGDRKLIYNNGSVEASLEQVSGATAGLFTLANVGIGTSSPDNGVLTILKNTSNANEDTYGIAIQSFTANAYTELLLGADDTVDAGIIQTAAKGTSFSTKKLSLNPNGGNVGVGTSSPAVKLDVVGNIRSSTGILFGTDTAAANALDDYEEGTWTPTFNAPVNLSNPVDVEGKYTKIGNVVNFYLTMAWDIASASAESNVQISLPFTAYSVYNKSVGHVSFFVGGGADRFGVGSLFLGTTSNSVVNMYIAANQTNATGTAEFRASYTYFVS